MSKTDGRKPPSGRYSTTFSFLSKQCLYNSLLGSEYTGNSCLGNWNERLFPTSSIEPQGQQRMLSLTGSILFYANAHGFLSLVQWFFRMSMHVVEHAHAVGYLLTKDSSIGYTKHCQHTSMCVEGDLRGSGEARTA